MKASALTLAALAASTALVLLASPAYAATPTDDTIGAWGSDGGLDHMHTLTVDLGAVGTAATNRDWPTLAANCAQLRTDTESLQAYRGVPDGEAETHLAASLAQFARASTDCADGVQVSNGSLLTQSAGELTAGSNEMKLAGDRITSLGN